MKEKLVYIQCIKQFILRLYIKKNCIESCRVASTINPHLFGGMHMDFRDYYNIKNKTLKI